VTRAADRLDIRRLIGGLFNPLRVDPARPRSGQLRSHKNKAAGIDVNL
jgi:hypothetical protein